MAHEEKVIAENCQICHSDVLIRQQHLNEDTWLVVLQKMKGWGSPIEDQKVKPLAAYLASRYGLDAPPYMAQLIPAKDALALYSAGASGPVGNPTEGKSLYTDACASCHGPDARGILGPKLVAIPTLWRWNDFNAVVVHGRGRMPEFGNIVDTQQTADILAWLRTRNADNVK